MSVQMTAGEIMDSGHWGTYCEASGTNEWCINEGRMSTSEVSDVPDDVVRVMLGLPKEMPPAPPPRKRR